MTTVIFSARHILFLDLETELAFLAQDGLNSFRHI
jgi:hypothetical protein